MIKSIFLAFASSCLFSQSYNDDPRLASIPASVTSALNRHKELKIYNAIDPLFYSADLDGDGKVDHVIRVESIIGKLGLLFVLSSRNREVTLGFSDKDDVKREWTFTDWRLFRSWQEIWGESKEDSIGRKADYIELIWEGRGGGMIEFRNGKFRWIAQGD